MNLILISLDTVRADVAYSGKFKAINKLMSHGVTFLNTYSSSPFTPSSHATVFTGLQPYHHGIRHLFREKLNEEAITLAQTLHKNGFATGGIASCPGMNSWYGFNRGFDSYDDEIPRLPDGTDPLKTIDVKIRGSALKRADVVVERSLRWLEKNNKHKFFLFMHFFDAHWPYKAPKKYGGNNAYEEEIAYVDHHLSIFLEKVEKMGILKDTCIVVFSDHGEDLNGLYPNDKGGNKLGHPEENGHGCLLYNQTQKVVLIINHPSLKKQKVTNQVRLVDTFPTVIDLLKIKNSLPRKLDGVSLVSLIKKGELISLPAYSETLYPSEQNEVSGNKFPNAKDKKAVIFENKYKVIMHVDSDAIEIYDLEHDPNEKTNLQKL